MCFDTNKRPLAKVVEAVRVKKLSIFVLILVLIGWNLSSQASTYLEIGEEVYNYLSYLEAKGCFVSSLLGIKPISQKEALRLLAEARKNGCSDPVSRWFIDQIEREISYDSDNDFVQPLDKVSFSYAYSDSDLVSRFFYNNDGDEFQKNNNFRFNFNSVAQIGRFSFFLKPEVRYTGNDYAGIYLRKAYMVFGIHNIDIFFGKDSQWWGPGQNGAILLSNNAEPFTMFRVSNDRPILLPWIFSRLGLFKFSFFVTRLDEERFVPRPYLWGLRLDFKPHPYLEVGLSRTALLGGEGKSEAPKMWLKSFLGKGENVRGFDDNEPGDQRAGFDVKLTLPFKIQPFQVYLEAAGEDEAGNLPYRWAYILGFYLPKIFTFENLAFKFEYAKTNSSWYTHHIYRSGYTYEGRIIGHHMGRDAEDYWGELSYLVPSQKLIVSLGFEKIFYRRYQPDQKETNFYLSLKKSLYDSLWVHFLFRHYDLDHVEGTSNSENINLFLIRIDWSF